MPHSLGHRSIIASAFLFLLCAVAPAQAEDPPLRHLFLDDEEVAQSENLHFTMHSPEKKGAVIRPENPWEQYLETRSAPEWDEREQRWQLWMFTSGEKGAHMLYVESKDGLQWTRPALGQLNWGTTKTNILLIEDKTWPTSAVMNVVLDPHETNPERRYKGLSFTHGRDLVVSPDGIRWQKLAAPRLASRDESSLFYEPKTRKFIATLKQEGGPFGRAVTLATSQNFEEWTKPELIFHADDQDRLQALAVVEARLADRQLQAPTHHEAGFARVDVYSMPVFGYEGLYIGLPALFYQTAATPDDGFHHVQLACSRDLRNWKRLGDRQPFIGPSPPGEQVYDTMQILSPSRPILRDNELWFYYTGLRYRYAPSGVQGEGAVCLATLRRDGFVSLDAGEAAGTLLTRPLKLPAGDLHLNVDAGEGQVSVQICDADGRALPGHEFSPPVSGDRLDVVVPWPKGQLAALAGQPVTLRMKLQRAKLYSYWFE